MKMTTKEDLPGLVGTEVGVSDWIEVAQERINSFADITEDHQFIHITSMLILFLVFITNMEKAYTSTASIYALFILLLTWIFQKDILPIFYLSFIFMLIPFLIVNGILTGAFIPEEVVWYNNEENLGVRIYTIPLDDIIYCFGMMLTVASLYEFFLRRKLKKQGL